MHGAPHGRGAGPSRSCTRATGAAPGQCSGQGCSGALCRVCICSHSTCRLREIPLCILRARAAPTRPRPLPASHAPPLRRRRRRRHHAASPPPLQLGSSVRGRPPSTDPRGARAAALLCSLCCVWRAEAAAALPRLGSAPLSSHRITSSSSREGTHTHTTAQHTGDSGSSTARSNGRSRSERRGRTQRGVWTHGSVTLSCMYPSNGI